MKDKLLKLDRDRSTLSEAHLAVALAHLNTRLRFRGLSTREFWTQRDQFTSEQLPMNDRELIDSQHHRRLAHNALNNQRLNLQNSPQSTILEGTIVYIKSERNKTMSRPRYLVTLQDGPWYHLKKFTGNQRAASPTRSTVTSYVTYQCRRHLVRTLYREKRLPLTMKIQHSTGQQLTVTRLSRRPLKSTNQRSLHRPHLR